jgi:sulfonate transport system substrate-binding protein
VPEIPGATDPAKAAAIRDYLSLLAQAHRWASTHLSAWAAVWAKASGLPSAVMRKAAADSAALAVPITPAVAAFGQQVAGPFTASGLILVHVNFSQFADASSNATASAS